MDEQNGIKELLQLIIIQNDEIKADIAQIKSDLSTQNNKIAIINSKVENLEKENQELKKRVLATERKTKRNNIIIFGVNEDITDILSFIIKLIADTLQVSCTVGDINNIYRIGQKSVEKPRPIILELISNLKKQKIFHVINKLKGTGITFSNDQIPEDREEHTFLYQQLKIAKQKQYNAKIVRNKLVVNGESYTYEDLKNSSINPPNQISEIFKNNSAPATPVFSKISPPGKENNKSSQENLQKIAQCQNKELEIENQGNKEELKRNNIEKNISENKSSTPGQSASGSKLKRNNLPNEKEHGLRSKKLKINMI